MRFQQIKDLLHYLEQVHQMLSRLYGRLERQADAERSRLLLAYLRGREESALVHLQEYRRQMSEGVSDTWLELGFADDLIPLINQSELPATMTTDHIVSLADGIESRLVSELSRLARECPTEGTASLLDTLAALEQQRRHRLIHGAHRLDDI
ncbi:hypothetical protein [Aeromonas schubertii]|uniref:Uncharacterized protein n=1 Tax=Aeromonas schubertii TaxID=652 RepID=A0ABS7VH08_9GAMM|nr:hypothetical protein [Aeromonas schubertii]KUE78122.1 hypothetical protein ATO46_11875 [Aeromonas schubertii]MBZ6068159.1 hypothetical protein [Aeromonas schubertii]